MIKRQKGFTLDTRQTGFTFTRRQTGFTLIELVIIIAIIGILFATLVAVINPGEQIRKAKDSTIQTSTVEFRKAAARFIASHNAYPWDSVAEGGSDCLEGVINPSGVLVLADTDCTDELTSAGELSQSINDKTDIINGIYVTDGNTSMPDSLFACYRPESESNISDPSTKYTSTGEATCTVGSGDCFWCTY